jgi:hypothetical protein
VFLVAKRKVLSRQPEAISWAKAKHLKVAGTQKLFCQHLQSRSICPGIPVLFSAARPRIFVEIRPALVLGSSNNKRSFFENLTTLQGNCRQLSALVLRAD